MKNLEIIKKVSFLFLSWRTALIIITAYGLNVIPFITQPGYLLNRIDSTTDYWIRWANWDGGHFLSIAQFGYSPNQTVFFPLYPLLTYLGTVLGINYFWSAFLISQISTFIALFFFYKLLLLDFSKEKADLAIILLLLFPTSFYLGAVYSEGLFLALSIPSFYFARKEKWPQAFILAGLSSVTRLFGLVIIFSIFIEYLIPQKPNINFKKFFLKKEIRIIIYLIFFRSIFYLISEFTNTIGNLASGVLITLIDYLDITTLFFTIFIFLFHIYKNKDLLKSIKEKIFHSSILWFLISLLPFIIYLYYQQIAFNNAFSFIQNESSWQRHLTSPLQTIAGLLTYLKNLDLLSAEFLNHITLEIIFTLLLIGVSIRAIFTLRYSYIFYLLLSLLIPLSSGTTVAISRYALTIFPFFIVFASIKTNYLMPWMMISTFLLSLLSVMFINAYWVT